MKYYVLTFHVVKSDGSSGPMVSKPMIFDTHAAALDYGLNQYEYKSSDVDFAIHETVLFSSSEKNNG